MSLPDGGGPAPPRVNWRELAMKTGLPIFPITIFKDAEGKWQKKPLTKHGHKDASITPDGIAALPWDRVNGFGIPTGQFATRVGWYAFDIDMHKPEAEGGKHALDWLAEHKATLVTCHHTSISGGIHLLYNLPGKYADLPTRANIVPGLDSRGRGGWIAFGEGYAVEDDRAPALLSTAACEAILAGYSGAGGGLGSGVGQSCGKMARLARAGRGGGQ